MRIKSRVVLTYLSRFISGHNNQQSQLFAFYSKFELTDRLGEEVMTTGKMTKPHMRTMINKLSQYKITENELDKLWQR